MFFSISKLSAIFLALIISGSLMAKPGKEHKSIIAATPIYGNQELGEYVQSVLDKLLAGSVKKRKHYPVFILDNPGINAFVTRENTMYIYRGLLSYLTSEAQLAAVLAHELGHIRDRHTTRLGSSKALKKLVAGLATFYTRNVNVADTINIFGSAQISGYGRELELKADELGAKYLYNAGYAPSAMQDVLSILKDHQRFVKFKAKEQGSESITYHGVFSSHPRNDIRLKEVIAQAGELPPAEDYRGRDKFRKQLDGLVFGNNFKNASEQQTFVQNGFGISLDYPLNWSYSKLQDTYFFTDADRHLKLELRPINKPQENNASNAQKKQCEDQLYSQSPNIGNIETIANHQDSATGLTKTHRVACIAIGKRLWLLDGYTNVGTLQDSEDQILMDIITSFRRAERDDYLENSVRVIYYQRARPGETFADLASDASMGTYTEEYLRLMNGFYPSGEPEPGTWLKLVR